MKKRTVPRPCLFLAGAAALMSFLFGGPGKPVRRAPANPEYQQILAERTMNRALPVTADGHTLGDIPRPASFSSVRPVLPAGRDRALPSTYDLRTQGKLTPVKDQGGCGSCWAFGSIGSLESYLMPAEEKDFSEQNLIDTAGFDFGPCDGGNVFMTGAYLARWSGPIDETEDPYVYSASDGATIRPNKHVQNVLYVPLRASTSDNEYLKQLVLDYGAVYISMYWVNSGFNDTYDSYFNNGVTTGGGGHGVCIVGWDDDYPASRFNAAPAGNGAFIVRNSWGTSWGESGYFYVSYYDTKFGMRNTNGVVTAEAADNYQEVFQYDPLGWVDDWGYGSSYDSAWGANIFTAATKKAIAAVGFVTTSANCAYEVYVYTGVTAKKPRTGSMKAYTSGTMTYPGFYTVGLPNTVTVAAGQKFSVVIKFTTPGYFYPVATEDIWSGYSSGATAAAGQSFMDDDGTAGAAWQDISADTTYRANCCIKAYTAIPPGIVIEDPSAGAKWIRGTTQTINWSASGAMASTVKIQLYRGTRIVSDIVASTDNDGSYDWAIPVTTAKGTGYAIKITTTDGAVKKTSAAFAITGSTIRVTAPAAGAKWTKGTTQTISWTSAGPQDTLVRIQLLKSGVLYKEIAANVSNAGSYGWTIPANYPAGTGYKIRVKTMDGKVRGDSGIFSLVN